MHLLITLRFWNGTNQLIFFEMYHPEETHFLKNWVIELFWLEVQLASSKNHLRVLKREHLIQFLEMYQPEETHYYWIMSSLSYLNLNSHLEFFWGSRHLEFVPRVHLKKSFQAVFVANRGYLEIFPISYPILQPLFEVWPVVHVRNLALLVQLPKTHNATMTDYFKTIF